MIFDPENFMFFDDNFWLTNPIKMFDGILDSSQWDLKTLSDDWYVQI
jgi:hypothetical protein